MRAQIPPKATTVEISRGSTAVAFAVYSAVVFAVVVVVVIAMVAGPVGDRGHPERDPDHVCVQP